MAWWADFQAELLVREFARLATAAFKAVGSESDNSLRTPGNAGFAKRQFTLGTLGSDAASFDGLKANWAGLEAEESAESEILSRTGDSDATTASADADKADWTPVDAADTAQTEFAVAGRPDASLTPEADSD